MDAISQCAHWEVLMIFRFAALRLERTLTSKVSPLDVFRISFIHHTIALVFDMIRTLAGLHPAGTRINYHYFQT